MGSPHGDADCEGAVENDAFMTPDAAPDAEGQGLPDRIRSSVVLPRPKGSLELATALALSARLNGTDNVRRGVLTA